MASNFREFQEGTSGPGRVTKNDASKLVRIILGVVFGIFLIITALSSFYTVNEQEQGVVVTFGKAGKVATSGLHFKIPYIQNVVKVDTTIQGFPVGYVSSEDSYNATLVSQAEAESLMITSDFNFVNVDFYVEYRVSDPVKYLYSSENPREILKNIAQAAIRNVVSGYLVDEVITTGKNEIQSHIKDVIVATLDETDIGIVLVNISMQDAEPPTDAVVEAFKAVETAKQVMETTINVANKYENEEIPKAAAEADAIIQEATAQKQQRINEASAQVVRFTSLYEEYNKYPLITKQRLFYETMEQILPGMELIITDGSDSMNLIKSVGETTQQETAATVIQE